MSRRKLRGPWDPGRQPSPEQRAREVRRRFRAATKKPPRPERLILISVAGFAATVALGLALPDLSELARRAEHQTIRVIDGDTIRLASGERIRILNIDAPEMPPGARCGREEELAIASKRQLSRMIRRASDITFRFGPEKIDRFGRSLRYLEIDGRDAGDALIQAGLAQPWSGRHAEWC